MENNLPAELKAMLDEKYLIVSARTWNSWPDSAIQSYEDYCAEIQAFRDTATDFYLAGQSSMKRGAPSDEEIKNQSAKFDKSFCRQFKREHTGQEFYENIEDGFIAGMKHYRDTYAAAKPEGKILTDQDIKDLKDVKNYFGVHDASMFEHAAYAILTKVIKALETPEPPANKWEGKEVDWDEIEQDFYELFQEPPPLQTAEERELLGKVFDWLRTNLHKYLKK